MARAVTYMSPVEVAYRPASRHTHCAVYGHESLACETTVEAFATGLESSNRKSLLSRDQDVLEALKVNRSMIFKEA